MLGKVPKDPVQGKDPEIQLVWGNVSGDPVLRKDSKIQLVPGKAGQYFGHTESIFCDFGKLKTVSRHGEVIIP